MERFEKAVSLLRGYHAQEALAIFQQMEEEPGQDKLMAYRVQKYIGKAYYQLSEFIKAFSRYKKALEQAKKLEMPDRLFEALYNMTAVCSALLDFETGTAYAAQAMHVAQRQADSMLIARAYNLLGALCSDFADENMEKNAEASMRSLEKGRDALEKALEYFPGIEDYKMEVKLRTNLGCVLTQLGEYDEALRHLFRALKLEEENKDDSVKAHTLLAIAKAYHLRNNNEKALEFAVMALTMCGKHRDLVRKCDSYQLLSEVYRDMGDFQKALEYHEAYCSLLLELKTQEYKNIVCRMKMEYDLLKVEKDNEIYRIRNQKLEGMNEQLKKAYQEAAQLSELDFLTSVYNRRGLMNKLSQLRDAQESGIILFDIDYFKRINDRYGHEAGDQILRGIAARVQDRMGHGGHYILSRWGGEEFMVILPGLGLDETAEFAGRLLTLLREPFRTDEGEIPITVTMGVDSVYGFQDFKSAVKRVDVKLYSGKQAGRNRLVKDEEDG